MIEDDRAVRFREVDADDLARHLYIHVPIGEWTTTVHLGDDRPHHRPVIHLEHLAIQIEARHTPSFPRTLRD